jgi:hypothetical protein
MQDQSSAQPSDRFKAEMPQIPGLSGPPPKPSRTGHRLLISAGILVLVVTFVFAAKFLFRPHPVAPTPAVTPPAAQIDVPSPVPDLSTDVPAATQPDSAVATVAALAKPWAWQKFTFRDPTTGASTTAAIVRLPSGSPSQPSGYWSFVMKPAYGSCQLEYIEDLAKLRTDYGYAQAKHPLVANPCTRSLYDPAKYTTLPGNVLSRGAVVLGTDLRPPYGIEIKVKDKQILAVRME